MESCFYQERIDFEVFWQLYSSSRGAGTGRIRMFRSASGYIIVCHNWILKAPGPRNPRGNYCTQTSEIVVFCALRNTLHTELSPTMASVHAAP